MSIFSKIKKALVDEDKQKDLLDTSKDLKVDSKSANVSDFKKDNKAENKDKESKKFTIKESTKKSTDNAYRVLLRPLVTEKGTFLGKENKYLFEVARNTNKIEIKKAIQEVYGVLPIDVNMVNMRGKKVRRGRITGKRKDWKKAIITLKKEDKIEIYEGV